MKARTSRALFGALPFIRRSAPIEQAYRYNHAPFGSYQRYEPSAPVVNDLTVLGIPAAWRAVDLIATTVSSLPLHAYVNDRQLVTTPKLLERPNSLEERHETIEAIIYSLIMRGNAYLLLGGWDELMRPTEFEVVHPDAVSIDTSSGQLLYRVGTLELSSFEIVHLRHFRVPGSVYGVGPVEAARTGIENVLALNNYGRRSWTENAVPSAVITVDKDISPEEARELKAWWMATANSREPRVLGQNMSVAPMGFSPNDAQFLESKKDSITDVANIFGVPATRLGGEGSSMTYQNIEQDDMQFLKYTIARYLTRIETPLSRLLPGNQVARFNPDAFLRMDTKSRYEAHATGLSAGFLTPNEVRAMEHLEPLEGGDELPTKSEPVQEPKDVTNDQTEGTQDDQLPNAA